MNISAQIFKKTASKRLTKYIPSAVAVMNTVDIDQIVKVVKTESNEVYIVSMDTKLKHKHPFHVWFMHRSGFILRSGNGALGYSSELKASLAIDRTIKLKGQKAVKPC